MAKMFSNLLRWRNQIGFSPSSLDIDNVNRYVLELKERVIINTKEAGANRIVEETENLKTDFDRLLADMQEARQAITSRLGQLQERSKASFVHDFH